MLYVEEVASQQKLHLGGSWCVQQFFRCAAQETTARWRDVHVARLWQRVSGFAFNDALAVCYYMSEIVITPYDTGQPLAFAGNPLDASRAPPSRRRSA